MKRFIALLCVAAYAPFAFGVIWINPSRLATGGGSPLPTPLLVWRFDGSDTNLSHTGTLSGGTLTLTGGSASATTTTPIVYGTSQITIVLRFRMTTWNNGGTTNYYFWSDNGGGVTTYGGYDNIGNFATEMRGSDARTLTYNVGANLIDNTYYWMILTMDATSTPGDIHLYIGGINGNNAVGSLSGTSGFAGNFATKNFQLGILPSTGQYESVEIYPGILNSTQRDFIITTRGDII